MASVIIFRPIYDSTSRSTPAVPWGPLFVAAPLVERGFDVDIIDECVEPSYHERVAKLLQDGGVVAVVPDGEADLQGEQRGILAVVIHVHAAAGIDLDVACAHAEVRPVERLGRVLVRFRGEDPLPRGCELRALLLQHDREIFELQRGRLLGFLCGPGENRLGVAVGVGVLVQVMVRVGVGVGGIRYSRLICEIRGEILVLDVVNSAFHFSRVPS